MADQATVSGPRANGHGDSVVGSIAGLGNDIATLAELQLKLAALDFKESAAKATWPLALVVVAIVVIAGSVPVAVAGAGLLLAQALGIAPGWGLLLAGIAAMLAAAAAVAVSSPRLSHSFESFRRSREELVRNINWIRTVLTYSGRAAPRRRF